MDLVMGVDIGTTAIKVIVLGVTSPSTMEIVQLESIPHDLISLHPSWAEEDASVWKEHLYQILSHVSEKLGSRVTSLKAVGLTGMAPALVTLDSECRPLRFSIQQNDMRTDEEIRYLKEKLEENDDYFHLTGSHVNSQHIAPRLLWLKKNEKETFSKIKHILGSYDYAAYLLTGNLGIESNWALESGMFSLDGKLLSSVISLVGIESSVIPRYVKSSEKCGVITAEVSRMTGIPEGTAVYAGTADHVASAFCTGARENGDLVLKLGGAGDILLSLDHLVVDDRLFIDYFVSKNCPYIINGCTAASGSLLKWFSHEFGGDFKELDKLSENVPAGSEGLVVLPYVLGEKTPIFDPNARGVIFGLLLSHRKEHIYRALLESVAYAFRHHRDVFNELGVEINNVFITNGGSTSPLWRQIMADVLGVKVDYIKENPGSCLGAAFIAGIAHSLWTEDVIESFTSQRKTSYPNVENKNVYDKAYRIYRELYPRLKDLF